MRYRIIAAFIILCFAQGAKAQQAAGQIEAGVRLGLPLGATGRYFLTDRSAVEGIFGLYNTRASLTALYQYHFDLSALTTPGLGWYIGGGAHIGGREISGDTKLS